MSVFTDKELEYLAGQRLGRLATVNPKGQPQNAPVGFFYNAELDVIEIGGRNMSTSQKYKNVLKNPLVAFVVDDILPPWQPRAIEVRGTAEAVPTGGKAVFGDSYAGDEAIIRIKPTQIISWGLDTSAYRQNNRKISY